jgi:hypothetical protein
MPNENVTETEVAESRALMAPANPFVAAPGGALQTSAAVATDQTRAITEVQGAMIIAKRFPRDPIAAMDRILNACTRPSLADSAVYEYSKGGSTVAGPSIRLAEVLAQNWGNIQCGVRELESRTGESTVEAFAWDVETGFRDSKLFQVPHVRFLAAKGGKPARTYKLEDPREIYEHVANMGARRKRACILATIPGDVVEAAVAQCERTQLLKAAVTPERLKEITEAFAEFDVPVAALEKRIQRHLDAMTAGQMVTLKKIITSMRDGMSKAADWFELDGTQTTAESGDAMRAAVAKRGAAGLKDAVKKQAGKGEAPTFTYAQVAEKIADAETGDALAEAEDLIGAVPDPGHQLELRKLAKERHDRAD